MLSGQQVTELIRQNQFSFHSTVKETITCSLACRMRFLSNVLLAATIAIWAGICSHS